MIPHSRPNFTCSDCCTIYCLTLAAVLVVIMALLVHG